jgi:hypothetical protein
MNIVEASESPQTHIRWSYEAPENADEQAVASEAVAALFALADGWLDIVALEIRIGLYDHDTLTEASLRPSAPFHLLRRDSDSDVRVDPTYRPIESRSSVQDTSATIAWLGGTFSEVHCDARHEPSLRELSIAGSRARLPAPTPAETLTVRCYAGEIEVPVDHGWVHAPTVPDGVPDPVSVRITNLDGALRLVLEVFWSPWADAPERPQALRDGVLRLRDRGWRVDE